MRYDLEERLFAYAMHGRWGKRYAYVMHDFRIRLCFYAIAVCFDLIFALSAFRSLTSDSRCNTRTESNS